MFAVSVFSSSTGMLVCLFGVNKDGALSIGKSVGGCVAPAFCNLLCLLSQQFKGIEI